MEENMTVLYRLNSALFVLPTALRNGICHVSLQGDSVKIRRGFVEGQFFKREMTRSKSI